MHPHAHTCVGVPPALHLLPASEVLRTIFGALCDVLGRAPSASLLLDKYTRLALVVDEVINEVSNREVRVGAGFVDEVMYEVSTRAVRVGDRQGGRSV